MHASQTEAGRGEMRRREFLQLPAVAAVPQAGPRKKIAALTTTYHVRSHADDIITKIRYMNQIALSVKTGLLDVEDAKQEMELTEKQLHDCVTRLRNAVGDQSMSFRRK